MKRTRRLVDKMTFIEVKKSEVKTERDAYAVGVAARMAKTTGLWTDNPFKEMGGVWLRGEERPENLEAAWRQGWLDVDAGKFHQ